MALAWSQRCRSSSTTAANSSCSTRRRPQSHSRPRRAATVVVCGSAAAARQPQRWLKVVQAHEHNYYFGYSNDSASSSSAAAAAAAAVAAGGGEATTTQADRQLQLQQLAQDISAAADWADLLQLADYRREQLTPALWLRLLFRLFVSLYEAEWGAADLQEILEGQMPSLLLAAADSLLQGAADDAAAASAVEADGHQRAQQLEQQRRFVGQLADMLYALAVLAYDAADAAAAAPDDTAQGSSSGAAGEQWYQGAGMQQLLDAVPAVCRSWDVGCVARKDAVSLLWAFGRLLQLQRQPGTTWQSAVRRSPASSSSSSNGDSDGSKRLLVSQLCSHLTQLIQLSNHTADPAAAAALASSQNPGSSSSSSNELTEPFHPEDLTDTVVGLAAAVGFDNSKSRTAQPSSTTTGFKSQAAASLLDAVAHEVYRQLSNRHRHSSAGSFTVEGVVALLQAYCDLEYRDGPSLRMFDAAAGWVVKRVRARHMHAPSSPPQLAQVAGVFARLQHRSVVVPELLNALSSQACKAAAAAVELAASDPLAYHSSASSSYCHWLPQHAATLLQSYLQLGYRAPELVVTSIMTALMLHWELEFESLAAVASAEQLEQQVAAVQVLDALAQLSHHPGQRVLNTLLQQAWRNSPRLLQLPQQQLVSLLFSTAQLAALPSQPPQEPPAAASAALSEQPGAEGLPADASAVVASVADELILSTMPEHQQQQQQQQKLSLQDIIRVLWSLCVCGSCLDIARYGFLLVAVAASPGWQRLGEEQLLVIKQGQVLLGQDGQDMAAEVLPAQLLSRVDAAWSRWCRQHTARAHTSSSSSSTGSAAAGADKPSGVPQALWDGHWQVAALLHKLDSGPQAQAGSSSNSPPLWQLLQSGPGGLGRVQHVVLPAESAGAEHDRVLLGAFVLSGCSSSSRHVQNRQQQEEDSCALQALLQHAMPVCAPAASQAAPCQRALLLLCLDDDCFSSSGQPPLLPLGGAVLQARVAQALLLSQQEEDEGEGVAELAAWVLPWSRARGLAAMPHEAG